MRLFTKCCEVAHNTIFGITLKALLLLSVIQTTYATTIYLGADVGDAIVEKYLFLPIDTIRAAVPTLENVSVPFPVSSFREYKTRANWLARVVTKDMDDDVVDLDMMTLAGVFDVAIRKDAGYLGMRCKYEAARHKCTVY